MNLFYAFIRAIVYIPTRIFFPVKIINKHLLPKEKNVIIMSNHLSWIDIFLIAVYVPKYRHFIAKKELGENPVIRFFAKALGVILIDREKSDVTAIKDIIKVLKKGHGINLFPEGTRNRVDSSIQSVKSGVVMFSLKGDAPIVPIIIHKKSKAFKKNYILAGEKITLDEFKNKQLSAVMNEATAQVEEKMIALKQTLDNIVANKQWVLDKKAKKEERRQKKNKTLSTESGQEINTENNITDEPQNQISNNGNDQ